MLRGSLSAPFCERACRSTQLRLNVRYGAIVLLYKRTYTQHRRTSCSVHYVAAFFVVDSRLHRAAIRVASRRPIASSYDLSANVSGCVFNDR